MEEYLNNMLSDLTDRVLDLKDAQKRTNPKSLKWYECQARMEENRRLIRQVSDRLIELQEP